MPKSFISQDMYQLDQSWYAHRLVLAPTATGKSAYLNGLLMQEMAKHKPSLVIVDVGQSSQSFFNSRWLTANTRRLPFKKRTDFVPEATGWKGR